MLVRRTVRWLGALSVCLLLAAAAAAWHFAGRAEGLVKSAVLAELRKVCPHAEIAVRRAAFDWTDTVTLTGLSVAAPAAGGGPARPFAEVAGVELTLDRARYREAGAVEVMAVTLVRPTVTFVRRHDGAWEAAGLLPLDLPDPAPAAPRWDVRGRHGSTGAAHGPGRPRPAGGGTGGRQPLPAAGEPPGVPDRRDGGRLRGRGGRRPGDARRVAGPRPRAVGPGGDGAGADAVRRPAGGRLRPGPRPATHARRGAKAKWRGAEAKLAGERPTAAGPVRVAALGEAVPVPAGPGPARLTDFGLDGDLAATFALSAKSFVEGPGL